jgi:hypothetical protein
MHNFLTFDFDKKSNKIKQFDEPVANKTKVFECFTRHDSQI